eukprot:m.52100 g.52100  ORF g.52100 m.52100 type:complete len:223 (+) comp10773_c0_seq2:2908-3576(+)
MGATDTANTLGNGWVPSLQTTIITAIGTAAALWITSRVKSTIKCVAEEAATPIAEVGKMVAEIKQTTEVVKQTLELPHVIQMLEFTCKSSDPTFNWKQTYSMMQDVRMTLGTVREMLEGPVTQRYVSLAVKLMEQNNQETRNNQESNRREESAQENPIKDVLRVTEQVRAIAESQTVSRLSNIPAVIYDSPKLNELFKYFVSSVSFLVLSGVALAYLVARVM